jgi:hypothetical protein
MRASAYDPGAPGGAGALQCILERYPGGYLAGCLDPLTPATTPPAQSAAVGDAQNAPGAAAQAASQTVAQAPGQATPENPPNGAFSTSPPTAAPTDSPRPSEAPAPVATQAPAETYAAPAGELPWWPLAVAFLLGALMAAAITYFALRSERERSAGEGALNLEGDGTLPLGVRIATPNDFSVHACDSPITLSANVVPPERAPDLIWSIVSPENRTIAQGIGAQFTFTASFTGVYHVVARLGKTADDLLLFVYKTPSGGTRLTDLLQAEPPPFPREPTSFVWNRSRTL